MLEERKNANFKRTGPVRVLYFIVFSVKRVIQQRKNAKKPYYMYTYYNSQKHNT